MTKSFSQVFFDEFLPHLMELDPDLTAIQAFFNGTEGQAIIKNAKELRFSEPSYREFCEKLLLACKQEQSKRLLTELMSVLSSAKRLHSMQSMVDRSTTIAMKWGG